MIEVDDVVKYIKPDKYFIDEYLALKYGQKSSYKYNISWHVIELIDKYVRNIHGIAFNNKYVAQLYVTMSRGPYLNSYMPKDTVTLVLTNDYCMKTLYQSGEIGKINWRYNESLSSAEKLEYMLGKKTQTWTFDNDKT
mgnify:CR=1 FL=1